jgi:hypothetical protein
MITSYTQLVAHTHYFLTGLIGLGVALIVLEPGGRTVGLGPVQVDAFYTLVVTSVVLIVLSSQEIQDANEAVDEDS